MSQLLGQAALVTGAEVGIGRATALALARAGADVAVHFYADEAGARTWRARSKRRPQGRHLRRDLTKSGDGDAHRRGRAVALRPHRHPRQHRGRLLGRHRTQ